MPIRALAVRRVVLAAGLAITPLALAQAGEADHPLPITSLTLYRSGVGYFERRAEVDGDQKIQLRFATDQINDILKSMIVLDLNQGFVDAISYGSKEPLQRRLASFGIDLSDEPPLGTILARLRGQGVKFTLVDGSTVSGTILGGETRPQPMGNVQEPVQVPFVNVVTDDGIRSVNLTQATSIELLDRDLNAELAKALAAIAEHHADRVKTVDLALSGDGQRRIVVAYVHEMPMWKTSYRLVLPEERSGASNGRQDDTSRPRIQGWAIVENTTDEDWKDVRLSLVAGRPVSFQMDLYQPLHVFRPTLPVPMIAGVISRMYEQGMDDAEGRGGRGQSPFNAAEPPASKALREESERVQQSMSRRADARITGGAGLSAGEMLQSVSASVAQGGDVGEVFQYTLENPVTVERQRSAMLPILSSPIDGRRVSIFNRADGSEHPMRGVELKNSTGLQLMPGPISVFDGASYAGDAQIGHVTAGDTRLLAHAVDLDVAAAARDESHNTVQSVRIVRGSVEVTTKQQASVTYTFTNKDAKRSRTILVEHPRLDGWDLVKPDKPAEETAGLYRFELALAAGKGGSLDVRQEHVDRQFHAVAGFNLSTILAYARDGKASQKVVDAIREAARLQAAHADALQAVARLDQERQAIDQDQSRIRQNMQSIAHDTELYRRYTTKLNEQESRLEAIAGEREQGQAAADAAKAALDAYIRGLNVE